MRELPFSSDVSGVVPVKRRGFRLEQEHEMRRELLIRELSISSNRRKFSFFQQV